ncbi:MgtC/SapB family protein [Methylocella sp. CPCC 101449]|uniref:MgtC/SapB family protein n=1 Tax=Methylocella sp. CPCC 101449 TaxID=2987531 RepID=UPI00288FE030|nr:MgtC/SapB family protein [Methylocella sp. CPCC 101449]MDT2020827.1 MgtC/SapB family protein [Methylocella sp. CPCC 101449]
MDSTEILSRLAVSLAIGLLIGLERGWRTRDEQDHQRAAGLRTFALSGLLGGVTGVLSQQVGPALVGFVFVAYALAFTAFHWLEAKAEHNMSVTAVVAGMITFLLGTMAVTGEERIAIAAAVAMAILLALREQLHRWVASLTWPEIRSVLVLATMSFLLLPLLPNRPVDPWNAINPYELWLLAILIAAISFAGYIAVKVVGDRLGIVMTAVAGGLASSTATTLTFAQMNRDHPEASRLLGAGILIAGVIMVARVAIVAVAINNTLLKGLAPPLIAGGVILCLGAAILLARRDESAQKPNLEIANPLALGTTLKLVLFIAVVMLAAEVLRDYFGGIGVILLAFLSGIADVDAITLSMAKLGGKDIALTTASLAILVAVATNTLSKAALTAWTGGARIGLLVGWISAAAVAAGVAAVLWWPQA